jgi:hypothetical protein
MPRSSSWAASWSQGLCTALLAAACGPSEQDLKQEFDAEVQRSNGCAVASECVVARAGCPLGCWVLVNAAHQARVEAKARELIDDYESGGRACAYECTERPMIVCSAAGKCAPAE